MLLSVIFARLARGVLPIVALAFSACGGAGPAPVRIVGSSTVYPFTTAVVDQFKRRNPDAPAPIVEATGTGGGIKLFCAGVGGDLPDMVNASRRITAGELAKCDANGVGDVVEIQIGLDGLVVAQARAGRLGSLSQRDIYRALAAEPFGRGANRARTWAAVNPALPAVRIEVIGPPPTSGTRDSFHELYMIAGCRTEPAMVALEARDPARFRTVCSKVREDGAYVEGGENDNLIVQKIAASPDAVGVFGFSFLAANRDRIRGVAIDGVAPTYANIAAGRYPAARPMYLYAKREAWARGPVREFLAEYAREATWGPGGTLAERGLVPSDAATRMRNADVAAGLLPIDRAAL